MTRILALLLTLIAATTFTATAQSQKIGYLTADGAYGIAGPEDVVKNYMQDLLQEQGVKDAVNLTQIELKKGTQKDGAVYYYIYAANEDGTVQTVADLQVQGGKLMTPQQNATSATCKGGCTPEKAGENWRCPSPGDGIHCTKITMVTDQTP